MTEGILIGREIECRLIHDSMDRKTNIIIFGDEGVGKSAILGKLLSERNFKNLLYSEESKTLKKALINFILFSDDSKKDVRNKNISALKKLFYGLLNKKPEYIVFDHIEWIEPQYYSFLAYLIEKEVPLIVVSQGLDKNDIGHLWMLLCSFEKVEIANLDKSGADELIEHYVESFGLETFQESDFMKTVFNISNGNPKIIKQLCFLAKNEKYRTKGCFDVKLMDLDRRINKAVI